MRNPKIVVVTASTKPFSRLACINSWFKGVPEEISLVLVANGSHFNAHYQGWMNQLDAAVGGRLKGCSIHEEYLGVVPAFAIGVKIALNELDADVVCCFHDDLEIFNTNWWGEVKEVFRIYPRCGLAGFGGAYGLGHGEIYQKPYEPIDLVRHGFYSSLENWHAHGGLAQVEEQVACLDGFSLIFRRELLVMEHNSQGAVTRTVWDDLSDRGVVHHAYDVAMSIYAEKRGYQTWLIPVHCLHYGGVTAVGDPGYQHWAKTQDPEGDHGFWKKAHQAVYDLGRGVLPLRYERRYNR